MCQGIILLFLDDVHFQTQVHAPKWGVSAAWGAAEGREEEWTLRERIPENAKAVGLTPD